ncbi:carbamoyl phosphate synthase-like protein [Xylanibacillus composti]|uniref:Carbamoyl phosphate synthase-like protein n=1 Tax=Xylanibacillus composti TaxID=1572762 RepID=A0A8J4M3F7_9BACL|nr:ATP-grasp domain-containing protein [Xylanibacillus composti]GIQ69982.1 carbamoyl phosphate synthase-like protein [Xylanibacillus composti]
MYNILLEASGSLTSGYLIKAIQQAGHRAIASDINQDIAARYLADEFLLMPSKHDSQLWEKITKMIIDNKIHIVLPSLDETLLEWSIRTEFYSRMGVHVITSAPATIEVCQDKWKTYEFFIRHGIPTPPTSLSQDYNLLKPRYGRGGQGVRFLAPGESVTMDQMITQQAVEGEEFTVDVFVDRHGDPVYIVPRQRWMVREGKSTGGIVVHDPEIIQWIHVICQKLRFQGPINVQCFRCTDGTLKFLEINPRVAGGMALGFAATENWFKLITDHFVNHNNVHPKPVQYGMKMLRYYDEVFVS